MNTHRRKIIGATAMFAMASTLAVGSMATGLAQQQAGTDIKGIKWTELQNLPLAAAPDKDGMLGIAEISPGAPAERHSHAENEIGYVLEGESVLEIEGEPPRTIRAGDSFAIPAGRIHRAKPSGSKPLKVVVFYIVERGKPLAQPAE